MGLFESSWRDGYSFYERYYDEHAKKSVKKEIKLPYEWYEPSSKGLYTYILDETIKLEKKQGNAKQGREHYGFLDPLYRNIRDNYWGKNSYNLNPKIWYLDIETRVGTCSTGFPVPEKALEPISLMQVYDNQLKVMFVLGVREWVHETDYHFDYTVKYIQCKDEHHLLETFVGLYKKLDPLIVYAWNGIGFDFPYIYNRMKNIGMDPNQLSNYGGCSLKTNIFMGKTEFKFSSDGHFWVDLMVVYKAFVKSPRSSYSLDNISYVELRENKVQHNEYSTFDGFYTGDYNIPENPTEEQLNSKIYQTALRGDIPEVRELAHSEFVYYGIKDTYLIKKLDDKLMFTSLMFMIADKMGVLFPDVLGTVKPWAQYILNKSYTEMKVIPPRQDFPDPNIIGGYVREPNTGKHKWVLSADVNSMYPLLGMVGFNMSFETYVPKHKLPPELLDIVKMYFNDQNEEKRFEISDEMWSKTTSLLNHYNMTLGINGAVFKKDRLGMVPEMVQEIYDSRKQAKKTMFKYQQQAVLIKDILKEKYGNA